MEGNNLFSKIVNVWLLGQTPAQAHRNRVDILERHLTEEAIRVKSAGRVVRVFNLGCGPAAEIQNFLKNHSFSKTADLTLIDFNQETLDFLRHALKTINHSNNGFVSLHMVKKSVSQILKEGGKAARHKKYEQYDYIYCAGLFDYLADNICKQLMNLFYGMLAPGGLLLATNVTDALNVSRPFRYSMEYILDWHLIYRDASQFLRLAPDLADRNEVTISSEDTGANLFLEVRKQEND
jgi:extracellular factor (EF) 3-hydroxypalmitic acid methyl ester biosynthesis protein